MAKQILSIQLTTESKALLKKLKNSASREVFLVGLDKVLQKEATLARTETVTNFLTNNPLRRRSGSLAKSIVGQSFGAKAKIPGYKVGVFRGPALAYAATQEYGTKGKNSKSPIPTITPKNKNSALTIPQDIALTSAGVPKQTSSSGWPNLKLIPFRNSGVAVGALYDISDLEYMKENGLTLNEIPTYYLLLTRADIRPTHFIEKSVKARLPKTVQNVSEYINEKLRYLK